MQNREMNMIFRIMGIVAVILCGITLIIPWAGYSSVGFYTWGGLSPASSDAFYIDTIGTGEIEAIIFSICMIIAFILTIITLIIGLIGVKNIGAKKSNSFLIAGILSIVAMVLCIVAVSQINAVINQASFGLASALGIEVGYSAGFFLILVTMIMFFITYIMPMLMGIPAPMRQQHPTPQQMYYQHPTQQQPVQPAPQQPTQPTTPPEPQPEQKTTTPLETKQKPEITGMFCPECGMKVEGTPKFCSGCGKKLG